MTSCGNGGERVQMCAVLKLFQPCSYVKRAPVHGPLTFSPRLWKISPLPTSIRPFSLDSTSPFFLYPAQCGSYFWRRPSVLLLFAGTTSTLVSLITPAARLLHPHLLSSESTAAFCPLQAVKLETLTSRSLSCLSTHGVYKMVFCRLGRAFLFTNE